MWVRAASLPLWTIFRGSQDRGSRRCGRDADSLLGSFPRRSVPRSRVHSSHCVGSAVVAIPHFVSHFHNFLPICNNWHSPSLPYETQPQKGYDKITFSVHWLATSVQDGIVHFGQVEKLQLFLILGLRRFGVWTWKDLKWTTVCFYWIGTSPSRYLQME